ncbi:conserved hypothetical protein [Histoplasma mississippiense (nom. inval.)]|uniref:conserved hypothetical protein n=1 Tax=Ajellomyces capsulatus (strain NAm1 / WU24) TaxID=2059318 RepID=UPI000157BC20|nr:conserved hypothetical protein [Histoplasma mississippiense (nom. inval.)]EDN05636.1 conserved hypothetical protein [Histoplasma mississippiense (nom. inval.)]
MRPKSRTDFAIAIICALPLEADAVEALFDESYDRLGKFYGKQLGDANSYINGRIGEHNIVMCYMPGMGKGSAASVASSLRVSYTGVQLALVVGICGGAPRPSCDQKVFLGDVIISDAVVEYDFGRQYPGGFWRKTEVRDILGRPDREIRTLLAGLKARRTCSEFQGQMLQHLRTIQQSDSQWHLPASNDILFEASYHHKHYSVDPSVGCCCFYGDSPDDICEEALEKNCNSLGCDGNRVSRHRDTTEGIEASVHIGKIASTDTVMKSGEHRDQIVRKERVIGFEMEGAGVWDNISCIIIKGVCDYADSHKNKTWQAYAAATGASAAKAFLEYWRPIHREEREHHWMVPFGRNPRFVGRQDEIIKLEELMMCQGGTTKIAICGLGGVGKTQVALELAYRMRDRDEECSIFWIPCTSYESVEQAYMSITQILGIQDVKPVEAKDQVKAYLSQKSAGKWLVIFDNADDMDMWVKGSNTTSSLKNFLPQNEQGHTIFTTRNRKLAVKLASSSVIPIPALDQETGVEILKKSLIRKDLLDDRDTTIAFLKQLTFLPLAITQAAAYVNENDIGLADYIALLQEQEPDVVELLSEDFVDEGRYTNIQNPVATTWLISFQQIQHLDELAADYLSLMACINPRDIPQSFLPQPTSKKKRTDAVGLLKAYSFINSDPTNRQGKAVEIKKRVLGTEHPDTLASMGNLAAIYWSQERWKEAEELDVQVVDISQRVLGVENRDTLACMANLASIYWNQGRLKEAEKLDVQVVEISQRVLEAEHPDTLVSMANLASTYLCQGRWKEAEELNVQVVEIRKRVLGAEHPDTLASMDILASIYRSQRQLKEAEELLMQVMEISSRVLGTEHPDTLTSMGNLAATYQSQGRWKEAEEQEVQVVEIRKRVLGAEHSSTLTSMNILASIYGSQGR